MRVLITVIFLLLSFTGFAQVNLVPNGSFEEYDECPVGVVEIGNLHYSTGWYHPTSGTPDFLHECAYPDGYGVPTVNGIMPVDGSGMATLMLYSGIEGREYIGTELTSSLQSEHSYAFSASFRLLGSSINTVGSVGAYFGSDSTTDYSLNHDLFPLPNQLQRNPQLTDVRSASMVSVD